MSSALIWHLIRDNNSFLVKRERTNRAGSVQFSTERGNVLGVNTYKYSGLANEKTIDVTSDLKLVTKNEKALNKPASSIITAKLNLHTGKSVKTIAALGDYRADLKSAATHKYRKLARGTARKAHEVHVVKSTRRSKH